MSHCIFCSLEVSQDKRIGDKEMYAISCYVCGDYRISHRARTSIHSELNGRQFILSGYLRERKYLGLEPIEFNTNNLEEIFSNINSPKTLSAKLDKLITYLGYQYEKHGNNLVSIKPEIDYPLSYAKNLNDFKFHQQYLLEQKLIDNHAEGKYLTSAGWKRYEELQRNPSKINQAFVAMWFGQPDQVDKMNKVYKNGIKKAVDGAETSPKYNPLKIDLLEHNDPIDQKILVEIRRSRFVIADLTGNRGGVYFEAGYALSLGIPVIWLCEKGTKVHFDVGQYSRIEWENENDLYEKLKRRIEGSIF
ncbi:MAG: hypothetical protein HY964_09205 [Ignavibacteriales bacterium]|nr:hypothetical protein [Ignavibacteriales bacterium]